MKNMFSQLQDSWEPLYDPTSVQGDTVPVKLKSGEDLTIDEESGYIEYKGLHSYREEVSLGVRESGPAAWGASFSLEEGSFFRWLPVKKKNHTWNLAVSKTSITFCCVGSQVDVLTLEEGGKVSWKRYTAVDIDA